MSLMCEECLSNVPLMVVQLLHVELALSTQQLSSDYESPEEVLKTSRCWVLRKSLGKEVIV